MRFLIVLITLALGASNLSFAQSDSARSSVAPEWEEGTNIEQFWRAYADSQSGLTWEKNSQYPEYDKVREGDLFMVEVEQGICLMEFFHNRWRRANDVRRWDDSVNQYSGCPYVFD